ncbi:hypothetical protein FALBO_13924 [Fusarium albosuccineum]|uniref:F-box domain-containing protein n=1 Tax=Fusarium albosuccineum TaxID=1237068 RepID=A0A8H4KXX0_9HYPO|nr:hypothetical protein FALBO_13924 [Fusarium albosuccineum]
MAHASLEDLPVEVLLQIFSQFCLHCQHRYTEPWDTPPLRYRPKQQRPDTKSWYSLDRHALFSPSLASRKFRQSAQRYLYHEFVLGFDDSGRSNLYTWKGRLISFMRTLGRRRDLASLVKVVYIHPRLLRAVTGDQPLAVLKEAADALGIDLGEAWKGRIPDPRRMDKSLRAKIDNNPYGATTQKRNWVAAELVAMLIAQLPNLEHLSIQRCPRWTSGGVIEPALSALGLSRLNIRTLDVGPSAEAIVKLSPDLETLNLQATRLTILSHDLPNLRTLRMTEYWSTQNSLQRLLSACTKGLESFAYESRPPSTAVACTPNARRINRHFQPSDAVRCLAPHKKTLKSLHLDLSGQGRVIARLEDGLDLKDFVALEHLFIGSEAIYSLNEPDEDDASHYEALIRLLPASIKSLSIQNNHEQMEEGPLEKGLLGLAELKQMRPMQFPKLRWVQCELKNDSHAFHSMFEAVQVKFMSGSWVLSEAKPYLNGTTWKLGGIQSLRAGEKDLSEDEL